MYQGAQVDSALGGDWYDAFAVDGKIVMTIGDVTGKGVDAARLMVQLRQWVRMAAVVLPEPAPMMTLLNRGVIFSKAATSWRPRSSRSSMKHGVASHTPRPDILRRSSSRRKGSLMRWPVRRACRSAFPMRPTIRSTRHSR